MTAPSDSAPSGIGGAQHQLASHNNRHASHKLQTATAPPTSEPFLLLAEWEATVVWLLHHTEKWPRNVRASLTQRVENTAIDVLEQLVTARYEPRRRAVLLRDANLLLERLRYLCRIAQARRVLSNKHFESAMRRLDTCGRMLHGWRQFVAHHDDHPRRRRQRSRPPAST